MMLSSTVSHEPCLSCYSSRFSTIRFEVLFPSPRLVQSIDGRRALWPGRFLIHSNPISTCHGCHGFIASTFFSAKAMCLCQGRVFLISEMAGEGCCQLTTDALCQIDFVSRCMMWHGPHGHRARQSLGKYIPTTHFMNINELFVIPVEVFKSIHFLCHGAWNWQWHFVLNCIVAKCYQDLYDPDFSHKWRCLSSLEELKYIAELDGEADAKIPGAEMPRWTPWSFKLKMENPWTGWIMIYVTLVVGTESQCDITDMPTWLDMELMISWFHHGRYALVQGCWLRRWVLERNCPCGLLELSTLWLQVSFAQHLHTNP